MRKLSIVCLSFFALSCSEVFENGLSLERALLPDDDQECVFSPEGAVLGSVVYDAYFQRTLNLVFAVRNLLQGGSIEFTEDNAVPDTFNIPGSVTPVRMDVAWECDSNGFGAGLSPLYLPHFSATDPFCAPERNADFEGRDVVPVVAGSIAPEESSVVFVELINGQLGEAIRDTLGMASRADACCSADPQGCEDEVLAQKANDPACTELQSLFDGAAGPGVLSAQSQTDVDRFRPFAVYDYSDRPRPPLQRVGPSYFMRVVGTLEGVTPDGRLVTAAPYPQTISICARCGVDGPDVDELADTTASPPCSAF